MKDENAPKAAAPIIAESTDESSESKRNGVTRRSFLARLSASGIAISSVSLLQGISAAHSRRIHVSPHQGRHVTAMPAELDAWMGKESGKPVHVATENTDLSSELKRGLSFLRRNRKAAA